LFVIAHQFLISIIYLFFDVISLFNGFNMAKKSSSKRKRSQVKNSVINTSKSKSQEIIDSPEIQLETIAEPSATDVNELQNAVVRQSEAEADNAPLSNLEEIIEALPTFRGVMDGFMPPNVLSGWVFSQEGTKLRVRIIAGSSILGETHVDRIRPDLMHLNNGLTGWQLRTECQLSTQEFVALAEIIRIIILDESSNMIGLIPIWSKLLEKLTAENNDTLALEKKAIS
jgi:hypothetical protein